MTTRNTVGTLMALALMVVAFSGCSSASDVIDDSGASGMNLAQQLTGSFGNVGSLLGSITNVASAENAVPGLNAASGDLDKLVQAAAGASPDVLSSLSDIAASQIPGLKALTDKIYAIPGVESVVKPLVDGLLVKFAGF